MRIRTLSGLAGQEDSAGLAREIEEYSAPLRVRQLTGELGERIRDLRSKGQSGPFVAM